ncbi:tRNA (adenosine(37)-N6)-threonylcarbamoyltransferase complex dimerization subunit type 1 TsaB [Comamonas aquatica]|nr:tRNA (adenosine(37)-N6)-threonylcarbamoyltransferase complex dimerization subunit type 1 TsaB [Comamonas aquatica]
MNLLAFDTSTDTLFIAIQRGDQLWQHQAAGGANSSATLIPAIQAGLQALDLKLVDLEAIVFGRGPGSFTGLRTSCAIAQGLALGTELPLLPIDTLLAVAEEARHQHGCTDVMAVLDARMSEVYHAGYRWADGLWQATHALGVCAPEALTVPAPAVVVGNAQAAYPDRLAPAAQHLAALPTATALLRLAPTLIADGHLIEASYALPLYIRDKVAKTTAEREAERQATEQPHPHA